MSERSRKPKQGLQKLAEFATDLRDLVFETVMDAARYFKLNHANISRYESGIYTPRLGYLACLTWLHDERLAQAGQFDSERRQQLLQQLRSVILKFYKKDQPFQDWNDLHLAAEQFMQDRWGENWSLERARVFPPKHLGNLPAPHEEQVGYEHERNTILQWLDAHDVQRIFIEGSEGVGKTWLAIEVAHHCLTLLPGRFEGYIWISAKDHPTQTRWLEDVLNTVARQLRCPDLVHLPLIERRIQVHALLHYRPTLLIIDNFNTIEDPDLEDWVRQVPEKSKVLITSLSMPTTLLSRKTQILRLAGLTTPNALKLLRHCARQIEFHRLASAPDDVLFRLAEAAAYNPLILNGAVPNFKYTGDFEQAVTYTIQKKIWEPKWKKLSEPARCVLVVTPFFAESMSGEALAAAARVKREHLYEALEQLERQQLLTVHEISVQKEIHVRYSIHPVIRSFATSKLNTQLAFEEQARTGWANSFIDLARRHLLCENLPDRYWNTMGTVGLAPIDQEWSNFREVLRWADAHQQDQILVDLLLLLVHYMYARALFPERIEYVEKAAQAAQRLGDFVAEAYLRIDGLAWILIIERRFDEALDQLNLGEHLAQSTSLKREDAKNLVALAHAFRAKAYLGMEHKAKAVEEIDRVQLADCSPVIQSRVLMIAGDIAFKEQNYDNAIQHYGKAIAAIEHFGGGNEAINLFWRIGFAYLGAGEIDQAETAFNRVLAVYHQDITVEMVFAEYGLAQVAKQQGRHTKARTLPQVAYKELCVMTPDLWRISEIEKFLDDLPSRLP